MMLTLLITMCQRFWFECPSLCQTSRYRNRQKSISDFHRIENRQKKTSTGTIIFLHWLPWRWAQRWLYCQQELIYISLPTFIITPQVTESKLIIAPRVNQFGKKGQTRTNFGLLFWSNQCFYKLFAERERGAAQTWMKLQSWERWDTIPGIARHCQAFVRNVWP